MAQILKLHSRAICKGNKSMKGTVRGVMIPAPDPESGPRFWCKNYGFTNGFKIGFRDGFRLPTLEKVQKLVVYTCLKIKMVSKAIFKAIFKAKIFAPESGP